MERRVLDTLPPCAYDYRAADRCCLATSKGFSRL